MKDLIWDINEILRSNDDEKQEESIIYDDKDNENRRDNNLRKIQMSTLESLAGSIQANII